MAAAEMLGPESGRIRASSRPRVQHQAKTARNAGRRVQRGAPSTPAGNSFGGDSAGKEVRAKERRSAVGLLPSERQELEHHWAGAEAEIGFRSLHGSIQDKLLRSPPNEGVQRQVIEQLERRGGHYELETLVGEMVSDRDATAHEARRAIQRLVLKGNLRKTVEQVRKRRDGILAGHGRVGLFAQSADGTEHTDEYEAAAEVVHLEYRLGRTIREDGTVVRTPAKRCTPEERWARMDAEARDVGLWWMPKCHESAMMPAREFDDGGDDMDVEIAKAQLERENYDRRERMRAAEDGRSPRARKSRMVRDIPDPAQRKIRMLTVEQRCQIERIYGYTSAPAYATEYLGMVDVARAVEFTPTVERRRKRMVEDLVAQRCRALEDEQARQEGILRGSRFRLAERLQERANRPEPPPPVDGAEALLRLQEAERQAKIDRKLDLVIKAGVTVSVGKLTSHTVRNTLDRTVTHAHVLSQALDQAPEDKALKTRWLEERRQFISATMNEATELLEELSAHYRGDQETLRQIAARRASRAAGV
jgi:hypothetical protein